ncbi:MAG: hypothetical protein ACRC33_02070 [Gemmataceae bacterium]
MSHAAWEYAVIDRREGRAARVAWHAGRLPDDLVPVALRLGYSASDLAADVVGELTEDLPVGEEVYLRGALVMADDEGVPAALFGRPLVRR